MVGEIARGALGRGLDANPLERDRIHAPLPETIRGSAVIHAINSN